MSTDPFVAPAGDDAPRQAQNLAPGVSVPPARAWQLHRPGDEVAGTVGLPGVRRGQLHARGEIGLLSGAILELGGDERVGGHA